MLQKSKPLTKKLSISLTNFKIKTQSHPASYSYPAPRTLFAAGATSPIHPDGEDYQGGAVET